jgi:hypothetical protein
MHPLSIGDLNHQRKEFVDYRFRKAASISRSRAAFGVSRREA